MTTDNPNSILVASGDGCPFCGWQGELKKITQREIVRLRGEEFEIDKSLRTCPNCNEVFSSTEDRDYRLDAYAAYREKCDYLKPNEIRDWRKELGLTQPEVTSLLGWGAATLGRYETGALQSASHEQQLRALMNPATLLTRIEESENRIPPDKRQAIAQKLRTDAVVAGLKAALTTSISERKNEVTGNRQFDIDRVVNVLAFLTKEGELKTKLNKLLFYSDFAHFRKWNQSITGLPYPRLPVGPAPNNFEILISLFVHSGAGRIEEKQFGDYTGEWVISTKEPDLTYFSETERDVLVWAKEHFRNWSSTRISRTSHQERAWQETPQGSFILYTLARFLRQSI